MGKKKKKEIKAKSWQIFSYYIMPFILGIITFFGFSKIVLSGSDTKLYTLFDLINKFNQNSISSLLLSLSCIGMGYLIYWSVYVEGKNSKINFNRITYKSIIIPLLAVIVFYFLPNIFVFLYNIFLVLIHDEKYKYTYLLIHVLWAYSSFGLIYYKDKDIVKIMKIHYSFVLFIFIILNIILSIISGDSFITIILKHRLRTILMFWFASCLPFISYFAESFTNEKYKDFLFRNDISDCLLFTSMGFIITYAACEVLNDNFNKTNLRKILSNLILKLNSISYVPAILTTLTVIFIGFAIYKTKKQLKD